MAGGLGGHPQIPSEGGRAGRKPLITKSSTEPRHPEIQGERGGEPSDAVRGGGALQGIGWALNEEYFFTEDGAMANTILLDYRMPTTLDLPMIDAVIVEAPNARHPCGVRGVGEVPIVPPPAAIAIYRAVGVRMTELPMSPGAVLKALLAKSVQQ